MGATLLGGTAIAGGVIALKSFLASTQASSHAHMHQMFLRYLEARDAASEHRALASEALKPTASRSGSLREVLDFGGAALYYLEEVFAWSQAEKRLATQWWIYPLTNRREQRQRFDVIRSWEATVTTQLITNRTAILPSLKGYTSCYGLEFLEFAAACLKDPLLSALAEESRAAADKGEDRPLGSEEAEQREALSKSLAADATIPISSQ
ncbi:hypothetical protein BXU08_10805 [Sphingomonas sp. LM7]|nr:hypothetical protein BXU08_10805 [Sphingomonas sp. LM7]